jgi:hypothetical protein
MSQMTSMAGHLPASLGWLTCEFGLVTKAVSRLNLVHQNLPRKRSPRARGTKVARRPLLSAGRYTLTHRRLRHGRRSSPAIPASSCRLCWRRRSGSSEVTNGPGRRIPHIYAPLCMRAIVEETSATPSGVPSSSIGGRDPSAGTGVCSQRFNHELASNPSGLPDCSTID